ncbi:hypothetical protein B7463_g3031, partial [Scytalidium lignicola]
MTPISQSELTKDSNPINPYPPNGINIIIVGAGLAGLSAALECHRKGMSVRILESNSTVNTAGDMFFMGFSATGIFKHWPEMKEEFDSICLHDAYIETFKHSGEVIVKAMRVADRLRAQGLDPETPPGTFQMRPLIYKMFLNQVEKIGIKVEFNQHVVEYFEDTEAGQGGVITKQGNRFEADLVIAADGVGSKSQSLVGGQATSSEKESWNNTIEASEVLEDLEKSHGPTQWAPIFKELIKCTPPKTIINFNLLWRDPQPSWTSPGARVVQIGDSAHSFLPASGNGATQAIEDGVSIATCLQKGGKENISQSIRAHIRFRYLRTACAQKLGFANAELLQETNWDKAKLDPKKSLPRHPKWVFDHDPEVYAEENYAKVLESMKKHIPFDADESIPPNYPPGYKYEPWSIDQIMEDKKCGRGTDLGSGDWP